MHIFISWSGERSKAAANGLRSLLEDVFQQGVEIFISDHIGAGENWQQRIGLELDRSQFGVLCLTQDNFQAPWLLFEAGAVAKKFDFARVVPYLIDELPDAADRSPLAQFQWVHADRDGTFRLIQAINQSRESPQATEKLLRYFEKWWPDLQLTLKSLPVLTQKQETLRSDRQILEELLQKITTVAQVQARSLDLPRSELMHLLNLRDQPSMKYKTRGVLKEQMRHLRDLGYIGNSQPIHSLPDEFELGRIFSLTDNGKNFLKNHQP